jgi:cytoskeletal protein RodZ
MWLRAGRAQRKLTLDDVARVTKIQPRILEKIEAGNLEGLPAEVFVRGFVKSFARCVGLDESEAVERYGQCANAPALPTTSVARAFVETLVAAPKAEKSANANATPVILEAPPEILPSASIELTPIAEHPDVAQVVEIEVAPIVVETPAPAPVPAIEVIEMIDAAQVEEAPKKKRSRKKANGTTATATTAGPRSRKKKSAAAGTGSSPVVVETQPQPQLDASVETKIEDQISAPVETPVVEEAGPDAPLLAAAPQPLAPEADLESAADQLFAPSDGIVIEQQIADEATDTAELADGSTPVVADPWQPTWQPTMPPIAASAPWKRPTATFKTTVSPYALPSLVIDDADPDNAEREREDRETAKGPHRVAFLPQILLDREDKSGRQGGLTLAVILLLIAATLTLSYLMRRPSVSGDGVTQAHVDTTEIIA